MKTFKDIRKLFYSVLRETGSGEVYSEELLNHTSWAFDLEFHNAVSPENWVYMAFPWAKTLDGFGEWERVDKIWRQTYATYMER